MTIEHDPIDGQPTLEDQIKTQAKDKGTWLRLFFMLLFAIIFYAVFFVTCVVAIIQFIARLMSGKTLSSLADFNVTLSDYARDLVAYLTYVTERKPFPFKE
jgi:hypothetical protein